MAKYVEYEEPAYDRDGIVINQTIRLKVEDAARLMQLTYPGTYETDEEALDDFIVVHWATIKDS
jgi:hypothetical protein